MRYLEEHDKRQTIGNMNGPWAVTLKLALVLMPILIVWTLSFGVWTVNSVHGLEVRMAERRDDPPRWLIERIDKIDAAIADLRAEVMLTQQRKTNGNP